MPNTKEIERRTIELARQKSDLIPGGELQEFERPDWLIPSASVAIEVSLLLPVKAEDAMFSGPQLSRFQESVVDKAEQLYRAVDRRPANVLVYFKNEWARKRDARALGLMAKDLAEFVCANYPTETDTVTLQQFSDGVRGWVDGISSVRIARLGGGWSAGAHNDVGLLSHDRLASRIEDKEKRLAEYRARVPEGWQLWLLFATSFPSLWSVSVPGEVREWRFTSRFDRVLLLSWEHGVLRLNTE
jgi:hypothetical protein